MRITRLDHITVAVEDLDKATETFSRVFGLKAVDRHKDRNPKKHEEMP